MILTVMTTVFNNCSLDGVCSLYNPVSGDLTYLNYFFWFCAFILLLIILYMVWKGELKPDWFDKEDG